MSNESTRRSGGRLAEERPQLSLPVVKQQRRDNHGSSASRVLGSLTTKSRGKLKEATDQGQERRDHDIETVLVGTSLDEAALLGKDSPESRASTPSLQLSMHPALRIASVELDGQPSDEHEREPRLGDLRFSAAEPLCAVRQSQLEAIKAFKELVDSTSIEDVRHFPALCNLGVTLSTRFERLGELSDLEGAITSLRSAVDLVPSHHPDKPASLNNLGNTLLICFERFGDIDDLEDAVATHKNAVDLTPDNHPDKSGRFSNLGNSYRTRFEHLERLSDLEDAISSHRDAAGLSRKDRTERAACLNNLGSTFLVRFERLRELDDLEHAISWHRDAVDLALDGHPDKLGRLSDLGNSFRIRFEHLRDPSDLEEAVEWHRHAIHLTSHDHPDMPRRLGNLGNSLFTRFECLGEVSDLEDAVELTPHGHPDKARRLELSKITA